ncbi:MAG: DNA (cytosine-5-)-methyltransferase [Planctomycetes bacterium]|nr:DNA (cytosine-5-)-methyltransferase [Planctomycetota bacterium]HPY75584.1 DNA (cytosine-5-)-methyltransferase [Planctomycetota bacterium]HQB01207.1 DNA (cytosine-5-)-methyltransferase [Planctomycetota bacterium]
MKIIPQISENSPAILIKNKRIRLQMTQKELADAVGMSKFGDRTIRRWENGEINPPVMKLKHILEFPETIPFPNNKNAKYRMIDLFAGIGGTRLGFYQTGKTNVVFSSEIDKFAIKTYKANFGETPCGDITKISGTDIPNHDILVAGFPCQAFSQAGKKLGFEDTRGTLFFEIARIIREKRPKAFLLENVKNLKSHDKGRTYKIIEQTLKNLNYDVHSILFKAKDFGVPQNRERIYIVGFDKEKVLNFKDFSFPIPPCTEISVGNILEKKVDDKYTISDKLWQGHQRRKIEHKEKGNGFGYTLFNEKSPYTNTLSARYYKDGSEILIEQIGKNPRKLTPREAARLQGFPENYIIPVSDTQSYKQFGNSVAVPVIHAIAKNIISILDNNEKKVCMSQSFFQFMF